MPRSEAANTSRYVSSTRTTNRGSGYATIVWAIALVASITMPATSMSWQIREHEGAPVTA